MSYWLRPNKNEHGHHIRADGAPWPGRFVESVPLVMHDACADANDCGDDPGRQRWEDITGQPLCWAPVYSLKPPSEAPRCYWCNEPVTGRC